MDDLTQASLTALLSETVDVYAEARMAGRTPHEAQIKAVAWGTRKASELSLAHSAMVEGASRAIDRMPDAIATAVRENWPADVDSVHMHKLVAMLKRRLPDMIQINLF